MKKSRLLTVGTALLALLSACGSQKTTVAPGTVVISGQIVGRDSLSPTTVVAHFQNPFDNGGSSPVVQIDPADGTGIPNQSRTKS